MQIFIITLDFKKSANFCRKLAKIAENRDHNIDPQIPRKKKSRFSINDIDKFGDRFLIKLQNQIPGPML
jgi:hypothetical protein